MRAAVIAAVAFAASSTEAFVCSFHGATVCSRPTSAATGSGLQMRLFDWKRRESNDGSVLEVVSAETLKPAPGSHHRKARKGRGIAAGQGASCGFGMRGQRSRSGPGVRAGFEGGQQPLYRRLPKYTGRPMGPGHTKKEFHLITLEQLSAAAEGTTVSFDSLFADGAVTKTALKWHKVVGGSELSKDKLTVQAHAFTKSAKEAIEARGGTCVLLSPTTNQVLEMEMA